MTKKVNTDGPLSALGTLAGGVIGGALAGPAGASVGGALGNAIGGELDPTKKERETDDASKVATFDIAESLSDIRNWRKPRDRFPFGRGFFVIDPARTGRLVDAFSAIAREASGASAPVQLSDQIGTGAPIRFRRGALARIAADKARGLV